MLSGLTGPAVVLLGTYVCMYVIFVINYRNYVIYIYITELFCSEVNCLSGLLRLFLYVPCLTCRRWSGWIEE